MPLIALIPSISIIWQSNSNFSGVFFTVGTPVFFLGCPALVNGLGFFLGALGFLSFFSMLQCIKKADNEPT